MSENIKERWAKRWRIKIMKNWRDILENVGGEENVTGLRHCVTRLRFNLKDESKANTDYLKT